MKFEYKFKNGDSLTLNSYGPVVGSTYGPVSYMTGILDLIVSQCNGMSTLVTLDVAVVQELRTFLFEWLRQEVTRGE